MSNKDNDIQNKDLAQAMGLKFTDRTNKQKQPISLDDGTVAYDIWSFGYSKKREAWALNGIYRDGFLSLCSDLSYFKRFDSGNNTYQFIKDENGVIDKTEMVHLKDELMNVDGTHYPFHDVSFTYNADTINFNSATLKETYFKQYHNVMNNNFLEHLPIHDKPLLEDTSNTTYLYFQNCITEITCSGVQPYEYSILNERDVCIWKEYIKPHEFTYSSNGDESMFAKFINNVADGDEYRINSFKSTIGYLVNTHKQPSNNRAVILYDEELTDIKKPEGGTGKGVFSHAVGCVRSIADIDGKKFDPNDKFRWQKVKKSTQVVWIDDLSTNVPFEVFHSVLSEGLKVEEKHKAEFSIPFAESPKWLLTSNTIVKGEGNTNERRQHILEFSPFYKNLQKQGEKEPLVKVHGAIFYEEWDCKEWDLFYSFIADCCQYYLKHGLTSYERKNINKNKLIQATSFDFYEWVSDGNLPTNNECDLKLLFENYKLAQGIDEMKQNSFTRLLKTYCNIEGLDFEKRASNGKTMITLKVKK